MQAPRVDLYTVIHKALRKLEFETILSIGCTDFADPAGRSAALEQVDRLVGFLQEHMQHEDDAVSGLLEEADSRVAQVLDAQHDDLRGSMSRIRRLANELRGADGNGAVRLGAELYRALNAHLASDLVHMGREETDGNRALQETFDDERLADARGQIQAAIPPPRFAEWLQLMLPTMNRQELIGALSSMKQNAPPPVFEKVTGVAREILGPGTWATVEQALG
jgi:hypothetical protein